MATTFFNVDNVYSKSNNLRKEDVRALTQWVKDQPHLPDINERQAILFLHRWNSQLEAAKTTIDAYFTVRTHYSDIFLKRNPFDPNFKACFDLFFYSVLSQKSHKGYSVLFSKILPADLSNFSARELVKSFDMVFSLNMYEQGPPQEYIIVVDIKNIALEIIAKCDVAILRTYFYYIQKVLPVKIKEYHLINPGPYIDKVVPLMKPFMEKELADGFYIHQTYADFYEHIPQSALPNEYGGSEGSLADIHGKMAKKILENIPLFDWENGQIVDESKRGNQSTNVIDFMERGSIRNGKFEID